MSGRTLGGEREEEGSMRGRWGQRATDGAGLRGKIRNAYYATNSLRSTAARAPAAIEIRQMRYVHSRLDNIQHRYTEYTETYHALAWTLTFLGAGFALGLDAGLAGA